MNVLLMSLYVVIGLLAAALFILGYTARELKKARAANAEICQYAKRLAAKHTEIKIAIEEILEGK